MSEVSEQCPATFARAQALLAGHTKNDCRSSLVSYTYSPPAVIWARESCAVVQVVWPMICAHGPRSRMRISRASYRDVRDEERAATASL